MGTRATSRCREAQRRAAGNKNIPTVPPCAETEKARLMFLPNEKEELKNCVRYLIERCLSTRDERDKLYQWREKYYLFGSNGMEPARVNNIASHLDLVTSFLYTP